MTIKTDSYVIGSNADDTRNFLLDTDLAGALRIRRKSDGSGGLVMSINSAGIPLDKDGLDMRPTGVGQTWQNVLVSRAVGTSYTNNSGRPIQVVVSFTSATTGAGASGKLTVGGVDVSQRTANESNGASYQGLIGSLEAIVPPGATYSVSAVSNTIALQSWSELRT